METDSTYPAVLDDVAALDDWMTRPSAALVRFAGALRGPVVVLGAGGKMGPSLCVLLRRAAGAAGLDLGVVAVSRFSDPEARTWLETRGVRTLPADLMERSSLAALPDADHVLYLVGLKFGTRDNPALTWAVNTLIPAAVVERYAGSRIIALSTGNVYPLVPVANGGAEESHALTPLGEYANACVARERIFQYASQRYGTPGVLIRLNYAVDLRYGVLVDLAQKVWSGGAVDVTMGYLNCIWQRDANDMIIRALGLAEAPMRPLNLTGLEALSVRRLAQQLGALMDRPVQITGTEADTALLSNAAAAAEALGPPPTPLDTILRWTAHWVMHDRPTLARPTKYEVRDGHY